MEKVKINMVGGGFQHDICSSHNNIPKYIEWDKRGGASISMHIDTGIQIPIDNTKRNFAWILESSSIIPTLIKWITNNVEYMENNFELIFTHDERLLPLSNKMRRVICNAVPWVKDHKIYNKSKLLSMIGSSKTYCPGHIYRQQIIEKHRRQLDLFGWGHNQIEKKEDGLKDFYYSIAMENDNYSNIFTEKITDCFVTGTIPIFWGSPIIDKFFNEKGIIVLTNDFKVENLSIDLYHSKMEYILENFERAINIPTAEDYIYENFLK